LHSLTNVGRGEFVHAYPAIVPPEGQPGLVLCERYILVTEEPGMTAVEREAVLLGLSAFVLRYEHAQQLDLDDVHARAMICQAFEARTIPLRLLPFVAQHYFEPEHPLAEPRTMTGLLWAMGCAAHELSPTAKLRALPTLSRLLPRLQP
jgi:hypothetical protein